MIVVFGSINVDLVTAVDRLPGPGETVKGPDYQTFPGGKGANQALAARRAGAEVAMVGAVGRDGFADTALALLKADGVDLSGVSVVDAPTGIAMIAVDRRAENQIIVASGANSRADAATLGRRLGAGDILLLQFEVPEGEVLRAAEIAKSRGARVILNAAPAGPVDPSLIALLDGLVVNEHEAAEVGAAAGLPTEPTAFAAAFADATGGFCVVTLGAEGAYATVGSAAYRIPAAAATVVDTTAAGDAFVGSFAAALGRGLELRDAVIEGVSAGSLAVETTGAQPSLPRRATIAERADKLRRSLGEA
ncbi:ribokinase [Chthonobacter albigriseus]|uniref:ribokinase n=1 Tax=Chthonobacter albigriseus TaxID=1683161 RepID=UPI0015EF81AD|nr:ribokinase [Chthonobacter albigriseus]